MKVEVECRGIDFFQANEYNQMDVVFGGDHGARRFRAVIQLIFRNADCHVNPYSVTMHMGNIDCNKDTREILQKTITTELNEGLRLIAGKIMVVRVANNNVTTTFSEEPPGDENDLVSVFQIQTFIAGYLAFFATILGKENMSSVWCTWCKLSKTDWTRTGHNLGECWTIDGIHEVRENVRLGSLTNVPENIKGCTKIPLFDSVPVKNYIVPVLHLHIGVGNNLLDSLIEWIMERVEKLTPGEVVHQNAAIYAEARYQKFRVDYDIWMENEGITLTDLQVQKSALAFLLSERVNIKSVIILSS
jgi:hypothetical protein